MSRKLLGKAHIPPTIPRCTLRTDMSVRYKAGTHPIYHAAKHARPSITSRFLVGSVTLPTRVPLRNPRSPCQLKVSDAVLKRRLAAIKKLSIGWILSSTQTLLRQKPMILLASRPFG